MYVSCSFACPKHARTVLTAACLMNLGYVVARLIIFFLVFQKKTEQA